MRLLLEKVKEHQFDASQTNQATIYFNILDMLCCCAQDSYPYHLQNIVSNDQLYGADPKFVNEVNALATEVTVEILAIITSSDRDQQPLIIALDLFQRIATKADVTDAKVFQLALNLWNMSIKNRNSIGPKAFQKVLHHLEVVERTSRNKNHRLRLNELINRIKSML